MAKKSGDNPTQKHGLNDVIAITLFLAAALLLLAQLSFDKYDILSVRVPANKDIHNLIGPFGAYLAGFTFSLFGVAAYILPWILMTFAAAYWVNVFGYLRERLRWSLLWTTVLMLCFAGFLHLLDINDLAGHARERINTASAGGFVGYFLYRYVFHFLGGLGAVVVYVALGLISLVFLTNFQLGGWLRSLLHKSVTEEAEGDEDKSEEERALERRAADLEKQKRKLEEEVERSGRGGKPGKGEADKDDQADKAEKTDKGEKVPSGLGADMKPVPEPTVRDLSVPQQNKGPRLRKTTYPDAKPAASGTTEPVKVGEVISAGEIRAATTDDVLGRKPEAASVEPAKAEAHEVEEAAPAVAKPTEPTEPKPEPEAVNADAVVPPPAPVPTPAPTPSPRLRPVPKKPKPMTVASVPMIGNYQLPTMDFLQMPDLTIKPTESREELMANARLMQQTLAQFDIEVSLGDITKGPTITRYELHPAPGVKLEKIQNLSNNLAAALKAERIHILAPVPGKSSVGVEVPNAVKTKVIMRDLFESDEWRNTKARVPIALGKDVYGHPIIADLAEMPHLLIAGSTGSGKSVCVNSIICSLLYRFSPDQLRFVMIDPKVVELQQYNALPHLVVPVVTDPKKVILALRWVVNEMEKRYKIFARVGVRNIKSFNERPKNKPLPEPEMELPLAAKKEKVEPGADGFAVQVDEEIIVPREEDIIIPEKLSYIVVIIDELADLMLVAPADVEMAIARITQMARAAGIHCIVATQRPSVDVITGVIKANIPARIAFQVASRVDSRTILDAMGADKLLGKGDMLYLPPGSAKLNRAQGALITDQELQNIVDFIAKQGKPSYEMEIHQQLAKPSPNTDIESGTDEDEELIQQCIEVIRSEQKASVSLLQRRLRLGYTRAARIMDELEGRGIVGPSKGAEPRDILIDLDGEGADGGGQSAV
jgi:DNA segregation ATPase FtsK/SpoIIIE, S-DNA-T family